MTHQPDVHEIRMPAEVDRLAMIEHFAGERSGALGGQLLPHRQVFADQGGACPVLVFAERIRLGALRADRDRDHALRRELLAEVVIAPLTRQRRCPLRARPRDQLLVVLLVPGLRIGTGDPGSVRHQYYGIAVVGQILRVVDDRGQFGQVGPPVLVRREFEDSVAEVVGGGSDGMEC